MVFKHQTNSVSKADQTSNFERENENCWYSTRQLKWKEDITKTISRKAAITSKFLKCLGDESLLLPRTLHNPIFLELFFLCVSRFNDVSMKILSQTAFSSFILKCLAFFVANEKTFIFSRCSQWNAEISTCKRTKRRSF